MFIYVATNTLNQKCYVGQTTATPEQRWQEHTAAARRGYDQCPLFYRALRKYGPDVWILKTIAMPDDATQESLDDMEREVIVQFNAQSPGGYNLRSGGYGGKLHPETCAKLSASKKGKKRTPEACAKISAGKKGKPNGTKGIPKSPEHRAKIGAKSRGRTASPETRAKLSASLRGRRAASPKSDATRKKLSDAMKVMWASPGNRAKMSNSMKGKNGLRPMAPEQKAKLIAANTGRYWSPEDRARQSALAKGQWQRDGFRKKHASLPLFTWLRGPHPQQGVLFNG